MDETQTRRQHCLEADSAIFSFGEGQALCLHVLRIMIGDDRIHEPGRERLDEHDTLLFVPQRRGKLQEGAVIADIAFVQRHMVDRGRGSNRESVGFGVFEPLQRRSRRD